MSNFVAAQVNGTVAVARSQSHRFQTPPLPACPRRRRRGRGGRRHAIARRAGRSRRGRRGRRARKAIAKRITFATTTPRRASRSLPCCSRARRTAARTTGPRLKRHGGRQDVHDGPPDVPQALRPGGRRRRVREPVALRRDRPRRGQGRGSRNHVQRAHGLHALLGRLRGRRHRRERRVDAAEPGVRIADQPGRALREGRVGARARASASTG